MFDNPLDGRDTDGIAAGNEELVRSVFDAFLRGDWDALAEVLAPDVEWLWHEAGDWDCHDRREGPVHPRRTTS